LGNRTTQEIKDALDVARKDGATGVVFTGGEVTIRKDVVELVRYAKSHGFDRIQLQTNGRRFADMSFLKAVMKAGANEFGSSLHGYKPELHDYLTRAPGAWMQTVRGLKNIKKLSGFIVINSVVVKPNYRHLEPLAELFGQIGVDQFQFAFMHAVGNADLNFESMMATASEAARYMKRGMRVGLDNGAMVMSEAMPYCLMRGFERYVAELYIPETSIHEKDKYIKDFADVRKNQGKILFSQCNKCRFRYICEGPWREYPERMGDDEFRPVEGKPVMKKEEILENIDEFPLYPEVND
jgi:MoaA/NifB/PqqE/SkfB family radical SAM enzyme